MKKSVVLAFSGGLDTSYCAIYLARELNLEVHAVIVNTGGFDAEEISLIEKKANALCVNSFVCLDETQNFYNSVVKYLVYGNVLKNNTYPLSVSAERISQATAIANYAKKLNADYVAHGSTGAGNDQVRFEVEIAAFDPTIKIIAPWRIWDIKSREDAIDYAALKGVETSVTKTKIYSKDKNLWHLSHEGGDLEDLMNEHKTEMYEMVTPLEQVPDKVNYVEVSFEQGVPKKVNGKEIPPVQLIELLNKIAGENGIGVIDIVENRLVGMKSRGVYETPAGTLLYAAHKELEYVTLEKEALHFKEIVAQKYGELIYNGLWFTPLREAIDAFIESTQVNVTGTVKLKLYKGNMIVSSIDSKFALYDEGISSFGASDLYSQKDSEGFINLFALPSKIMAHVKNKNK